MYSFSAEGRKLGMETETTETTTQIGKRRPHFIIKLCINVTEKVNFSTNRIRPLSVYNISNIYCQKSFEYYSTIHNKISVGTVVFVINLPA